MARIRKRTNNSFDFSKFRKAYARTFKKWEQELVDMDFNHLNGVEDKYKDPNWTRSFRLYSLGCERRFLDSNPDIADKFFYKTK